MHRQVEHGVPTLLAGIVGRLFAVVETLGIGPPCSKSGFFHFVKASNNTQYMKVANRPLLAYTNQKFVINLSINRKWQ